MHFVYSKQGLPMHTFGISQYWQSISVSPCKTSFATMVFKNQFENQVDCQIIFHNNMLVS